MLDHANINNSLWEPGPGLSVAQYRNKLQLGTVSKMFPFPRDLITESRYRLVSKPESAKYEQKKWRKTNIQLRCVSLVTSCQMQARSHRLAPGIVKCHRP